MGESPGVQSLLQNLSDHIQEHKAVTYKWFAREYSLPANYAKQLLFRFAEEQGSKIRAVYAVSGFSKADAGLQQHVVRLVPAMELEACCGQLQEGTISVHIHSVLPSADDCTLEPAVLYAEDAEQSRHFYQAMTEGAAVINGSADVYARNVCSSISFTASIMTPEERRKRIQDKLQQQKAEQEGGAGANKNGGKAKKQSQQQTKQPPKLSPAVASIPLQGNLASPAPGAQPVLSPMPAAPAGTVGGNGSSAGGTTSPFVRSPAPSPAATPAAAAAAAAAPEGKAVKAAAGGSGGKKGGSSSATAKGSTAKGGKQGGLANLWGKAAKATPKATKQPAPNAPPAAAEPAAKAAAPTAAADVQDAAADDDVVVGSKRRRGRQLLVDEDDDDDEGTVQQQSKQQQDLAPAKAARGRVLMDIDSDDDEEGHQPGAKQQQQPVAAATAPKASSTKNATVKGTAAEKDAGRPAGPQQQQKQQPPQQKQRQVQGDCDASKDQAAAPPAAAAASTKPNQQLSKGRDAGRREPAEAADKMTSPLVSKAAARSATDAATATPAVEMQTPAAAATPTQPPAKRQKGFAAGFGFSAQAGQPRIDPVTGEEIWGEEEEKPTPKPGFISTPAVVGGSKAAAVFGGKAAAKASRKAAGDEAGNGAASTGAKKKAAAAGSKKAAAGGKVAQKNIMSFFGKS